MGKKKDPVQTLISDITEVATKNKGAVLGAIVGYLASSTIEEHPEIRNAVLGAIVGEGGVRALKSGKKDEDNEDDEE